MSKNLELLKKSLSDLKNCNLKKVEQPIVLIANTSKYLVHYRSLLIDKLYQSYKKLFVFKKIDCNFYHEKKRIRRRLHVDRWSIYMYIYNKDAIMHTVRHPCS